MSDQRDGGIAWTDQTWAKFVSLIDRRSESECWNWKAGAFTNGYGQFRVGPRKVRAHRAYFERVAGPVAADKILCHRCDNRLCCNPAHIFVGTHADNAADRDAKGRGRAVPPPGMPGVLNPSAKLTAEQVASIRSLRAEGATLKSIAKRFDVSPSNIRHITTGRNWR